MVQSCVKFPHWAVSNQLLHSGEKQGLSLPLAFSGAAELLLSLDWRVLPLIPPCCLLLHGKSWPQEDKLSKYGLDHCLLICLLVPTLNLPHPPHHGPESIFHTAASMFFQRCNFDLDFPALKTLRCLLINFRIKFSP